MADNSVYPFLDFAESIGTNGFTAEPPYTILVTGVMVTSVRTGWTGPVRLLLEREGRSAVYVWGGEPLLWIYRRVRLWLRPGDRWRTLGGVFTLTGDRMVVAGIVLAPPLRDEWSDAEDEAVGLAVGAGPSSGETSEWWD